MARRPDGSKPGGQPPARPSWRKPSASGAAPARNYHWLRRGPGGPPGKWRRRLVRYGLIGLALALIGVFIRYVFFIPVKTPLVAIVVTDYAPPYPPNAWAREDVDEFNRIWPSSAAESRLAAGDDNLHVTEVAEAWRSEKNALGTLHQVLDPQQLRPGGPDEDVVLLYLSAHGMLDAAGEPCLLLGGTLQDEQSAAGASTLAAHTLKLSSLLREVAESIDPATKKVLIFDANRIDTNWPLGILANGFADRLEQAVRDAKIDNLYVLNSVSPGEVGHVSPKLQASLFAHYLAAGLQQQGDSNGNGEISLQELFDFVRDSVAAQSVLEWHETQRPMLISSGPIEAAKDVNLAYVKKPAQRSGSQASSWDSPLDREALAELWQKHAALRPWQDLGKPAPNDDAPSAGNTQTRHRLASWEAFQQALLRYELVVRAGKAYRDEASRLKSQLDALAVELASAATTDGSTAFSLPLAELLGRRPADSEVAAASQWLRTPPKPDAPPLQASRAARAVAAWKWTLESAQTDRVKRALELVDGAPADEQPACIELHFLRALSAKSDLLPETIAGDTAIIQAALECRRTAEDAAIAAGDERVQYFVRDAINAADQMRRAAEDRLFVGNPTDRALAARDFDRANEQYQAAMKRAASLARAYDVRDRGAAHLPYLASWMARRPAAPEAANGPRVSLLRQLNAAITAHQRLAERLETIAKAAQGNESATQPDTQLRELVGTAEGELRRLEGQFESAVSTASASAGDQENLREIEELLAVPLATGETRTRLLNVMVELLNRGAPTANAATAAKQSPATPTAPPLYWQWRSIPHPAALLTGLDSNDNAAAPADAPAPTPSAQAEALVSLAALGAKLHAAITQAPAEIGALLRADPSAAQLTVSAARQRSASAVRIARTHLPWLALSSRYGEPEQMLHDAFGRLERLDRQQLMAWHGERALDDFWGPDDRAKPDNTYFAAVSGRYLEAARQLDPELTDSLTDFAKRRTERIQAAADPLAITVNGVAALEGSTSVKAQIGVTPNSAAPRGVAAVYVLDAAGRPAAIAIADAAEPQPRFEVDVTGSGPNSATSAAANARSMEFTPAAATGDATQSTGGDWTLVGLYRAHRIDHPFPVVHPEVTRQVVWDPAPPVAPKLYIEGRGGDPGSIAFVLDCSASMKKRSGPNRMDPARNALLQILGELANQNRKYRVSLWLYGHRCNNDESGKSIWHEQWIKVPGMLPCDDVQQVIAPRELDPASLKAFRDLLNAKDARGYEKVSAFGLTPLHLAMIKAVQEDLNDAPKQAPRRLIVITDGNNNVEPNPGATWQPTKRWSALEVRNALTNVPAGFTSPIHVDMLACDVPDMAPLNALLADPVDGRVVQITNVNTLTANLKEALGLYTVAVEPLNDSANTRGKRDVVVDQEIELPMPRGREDYSATLVGRPGSGNARFEVEGGERIVLQLLDEERRLALVHPRYNFQGEVYRFPPVAGHPTTSPPNEDFDPATFAVSVLRPKQEGAVVPFRISMQNGNPTRFSPRPVESWVEITPRGGGDAAGNEASFEPYIFYDPTFQPALPAPVLVCQASNWPPEARAADISLFFKMHATPATRSLRIGEVQRLGEQPEERLALKLQSGQTVKFAVDVKPVDGEADSWQVIVEELHAADDRDLASVKVALSHNLNRTIRRYYSAEGRVQHTFILKGTRRALIDNFELNVTSRDDLLQDAATVEKPLRVIVSAGGR